MTITREEMDSIFKECDNFFDKIDEMDKRQRDAKSNIEKLQEETLELKNKDRFCLQMVRMLTR